MKVARSFALVMVLAVPLYTGCFRKPSAVLTKGHMDTGMLGEYEFQSQQDVTVFNEKICAWLSNGGYAPDSDRTFSAIVGKDRWKVPGLLLSRNFDANNQIFIFVPDFYSAKDNLQIIGYHVTMDGPADTVTERMNNFNKLKKEFQTLFPDTVTSYPKLD